MLCSMHSSISESCQPHCNESLMKGYFVFLENCKIKSLLSKPSCDRRVHDRSSDATLPVPGFLQGSCRRVPKRSTPVSYGWKGKHRLEDLPTLSKPETTEAASQDAEEQSSELIKAGRLSLAADEIPSSRASEAADCGSQEAPMSGNSAAESSKFTEGGVAPQQVRSHTKSATQLARQVAGNLAAAFRFP